jgi:hypothetical protein
VFLILKCEVEIAAICPRLERNLAMMVPEMIDLARWPLVHAVRDEDCSAIRICWVTPRVSSNRSTLAVFSTLPLTPKSVCGHATGTKQSELRVRDVTRPAIGKEPPVQMLGGTDPARQARPGAGARGQLPTASVVLTPRAKMEVSRPPAGRSASYLDGIAKGNGDTSFRTGARARIVLAKNCASVA